MRQIEWDAMLAEAMPFEEHELDAHPDRDRILATMWAFKQGRGERFQQVKPPSKEASKQQG